MFGKTGFLKRVNSAVDAVLEQGEERVMAVYVQGPRRPPSSSVAVANAAGAAAAIVSGASNAAGMMSSAWLLALTDRRFLVLAMDGMTAKSATLAAAFPADAVRCVTAQKGSFELAFPEGDSVRYSVLPAWRREGSALVELLSDSPT
jgi:hypothetical protein